MEKTVNGHAEQSKFRDSRNWTGGSRPTYQPSTSFAKSGYGRTNGSSYYASGDAGEEFEEGEKYAGEEDEETVVDEGKELLKRLMIRELKKETDVQSEVHQEIRQFLEKSVAKTVRRQGAASSAVGLQQDQIVDALSRIGDALEADRELNMLIFQVPPEASWATFQNVAHRLFADGNITWGRIVALFFFACRLVKRAINNVPMLEMVLEWVSRIIKARLVVWVLGRGGWRAVMEWFGPRWSQIGMAFGVFCATYVATVTWTGHR